MGLITLAGRALLGRRKKSIARVWVKKGTGDIRVNGKKMNDYFVKLNLQTAVIRPFAVTKRENEFDVKCSVKGGGLSGQAGAIILGIARALNQFEPDLKSDLKKEKLTTRTYLIMPRKRPSIDSPRCFFFFFLSAAKHFQKRSVSSPAAETTVDPSGDMAMPSTRCEWPVSSVTLAMEGYFQMVSWLRLNP